MTTDLMSSQQTNAAALCTHPRFLGREVGDSWYRNHDHWPSTMAVIHWKTSSMPHLTRNKQKRTG